MKGGADLTFYQILSEAVRYIPFDLGARLSPELFEEISAYLSKNFQVSPLTKREKVILYEKCICTKITDQLFLYIFQTGIGLFKYYSKPQIYIGNMTFAARYLEKRKKSHQKILNWTHDISPVIYVITKELRELVRKHKKELRPSASSGWEYNGLSYVMTMVFFSPLQGNVDTSRFDRLPRFLQKGIPAILKPDLIGYDDSNELSKMNAKKEKVLEYLENIHSTPVDYDDRKQLMIFMSWAAVIIFGEFDDSDKEIYELIELNLQHYWFYLYCLDQWLPIEKDEFKQLNLSIDQCINLKVEIDDIPLIIQYTDESRLPERFKPMVDGLSETSRIHQLLEALSEKLDSWIELLSNEEMRRAEQRKEEAQKKFAKNAALALYTIAFIEITPDLYDFFNYLVEISGFNLVPVQLLLTALILVLYATGAVIIFKSGVTSA